MSGLDVAVVGRLDVVGTPGRVGYNMLEAGEVVDGCTVDLDSV